ncbi:MAG: hypothetical protein U0T84_02840 [Chitinophagales bacterium]
MEKQQQLHLLWNLQKHRLTPGDSQKLAEVLRFYLAFPATAQHYRIAKQLWAVHRSTSVVQATGAFSLGLCFSLATHSKATLKLISQDAAESEQISVLTLVAGQAATEILLEGHITVKAWFQRYRQVKGAPQLEDWLAIFRQSTLNIKVLEQLWQQLQMQIAISFSEEHLLLPLLTPLQTHRMLDKSGDVLPLFPYRYPELKTSLAQRAHYIDTARLTLATLHKETEPVSTTTPELSRLYDAGNGLVVLLMDMPAAMRQPIDSYIGYMAFKNGIPVAYGGGWIMFDSCRIGVNIFPAFRGGESMRIFGAVCALYARVFRLNRFTVDPYQIGKNNADGIRSGAFWMYYKMGFRPEVPALRQLADTEWIKLRAEKGYRSPAKVLKQLAQSKLVWVWKPRVHPVPFDATSLSAVFARATKGHQGLLDKLFRKKQQMNEWQYIRELQQHDMLRKQLEQLWREANA